MSRELIAAKVPLDIGFTIAARAEAKGVTISAYVAEVLRQHVSGGALTFAPCRMGPEPTGKKRKSRTKRTAAM